MAIENLKFTARLKNKTWTTPQIKNHKYSHDLRLIRQQIYLITYLLTYLTTYYLLAYCMEQSPSWDANRLLASQEIPCILWNPEVLYCIY
jgi:hypothetical protein